MHVLCHRYHYMSCYADLCYSVLHFVGCQFTVPPKRNPNNMYTHKTIIQVIWLSFKRAI